MDRKEVWLGPCRVRIRKKTLLIIKKSKISGEGGGGVFVLQEQKPISDYSNHCIAGFYGDGNIYTYP